MYYRITYNNQGIYQAFRKKVSFEDWKKILKSDKINWLPKPPDYAKGFNSYFTQTGYKKFEQLVLPIFKKILNEKQIKVERISSLSGKIKYQDQYQVVIQKKYIKYQSKFEEIYKKIINN